MIYKHSDQTQPRGWSARTHTCVVGRGSGAVFLRSHGRRIKQNKNKANQITTRLLYFPSPLPRVARETFVSLLSTERLKSAVHRTRARTHTLKLYHVPYTFRTGGETNSRRQMIDLRREAACINCTLIRAAALQHDPEDYNPKTISACRLCIHHCTVSVSFL